MNTLAIVFTHNRPAVLRHCVNTLFGNTVRLPDRTIFIDDGSGDDEPKYIYEAGDLWTVEKRAQNWL
jgi:GT2 family glycosyltransferase